MHDSVVKVGAYAALTQAITTRSATVGVIGLGYVGLPLAMAIARAGFPTIGFDVDVAKIDKLNDGMSYIGTVNSKHLSKVVGEGHFRATSDFSELKSCDVIIICVPTPLTRYREPDLSFIQDTTRVIARHVRVGQLVVLESTTFPGTTNEVVRPILESNELKAGLDFFLGFSPEREDPGNSDYRTDTIPKIVSGEGPEAKALVELFYSAVVKNVVPVSAPQVAEAVKITENIFRAVNIALVNELKVIFDAMGIDVWEVIDAAATKPFGYMPFYPGPGLGGHCIPIDPFYLTWKSREYGLPTRFIELAGEINVSMPRYVVTKLEEALDRQFSVPFSKARILIVGVAYKKNVDDIRESPSFKLIELLENRGTEVDFHDPHVSEIFSIREHPQLAGRKSVTLDGAMLNSYHAAVIVTDHDAVDYALIAAHAPLVVDTRNVFARKRVSGGNIVKC